MSTTTTVRCGDLSHDIPCQKQEGHGGGHWYATDEVWQCLGAGHYAPTDVVSGEPFTHLDVPCHRRPERSGAETTEVRA